QFAPEWGGQFEPGTGGHFKPEWGGQFERNLHTPKSLLFNAFISFIIRYLLKFPDLTLRKIPLV
ncbi:hypothetical protein SAMN05216464_113163, partial [Mucilaginibacter pineti]